MNLIDRVLKQIETDMYNEDLTALEELLAHVPEEILAGYLSEDFENDGQPDEAQEWHDFDPDC